MKNTTKSYSVKSSNFDWHEAIPCGSYTEALDVAKSRGWVAHISHHGTLVAVWCPLYGTRVYDRTLAR